MMDAHCIMPRVTHHDRPNKATRAISNRKYPTSNPANLIRNSRMKKIIALLITALVTGCATNFANKAPTEVANALMVKNSEFDEKITYIGPQAFSETRRGIFVDNEVIQLIAVKDKKTNQVSYLVYTRIMYSSNWRFYNSISLENGTQLATSQQNRKVNTCTGAGCIFTEEFTFPIDRASLNISGSFKYRANSKSGAENIITINKSYIDGFLLALKRHEI